MVEVQAEHFVALRAIVLKQNGQSFVVGSDSSFLIILS